MGFVDTGLNIPESLKTLLAQQVQLKAGKRHVQMFPAGLMELPLPEGMARHENIRGVFHFRPEAISPYAIEHFSTLGRENEFLNLGPYNKTDIAERMERGEALLAVVEIDPEGVEVRAAAGTPSIVPEQVAYFENTKDEANAIIVTDMIQLLARRLS